MAKLYDPERLSKIAEIMPRFNQHVRPGDEIALGLEGDPEFPKAFENDRPVGIVQKVKSLDDGETTSLRVQLQDGSTVDIMPHSIDPTRVWEFTNRSFQNVLRRSIEENAPEMLGNEEATYRGAAEGDDMMSLRAQMNDMKVEFEREMKETRAFNNTLIATLHEMANDVCKMSAQNGDKSGFCSIFANEYEKMMGESSNSKVFESDFSDSDSDDDLY